MAIAMSNNGGFARIQQRETSTANKAASMAKYQLRVSGAK